MKGFEIVTIVIGVFFVVGVIVGVLLVITLPLLRAVFWHRRNNRRYLDGGNWWKLPSRDDERRPPRWPGG